jgi:hypothetical protein
MMGAPEKKKRLALFMRNCVVSDQILLLPLKDQNDTFWTMPPIMFIAIRARAPVEVGSTFGLTQ